MEGEVSCGTNISFLRPEYGVDKLIHAYSPLTADETLKVVETIFKPNTERTTDCVFRRIVGYNIDKTRLINSGISTKSGQTMEMLKSGATFGEKAAMGIQARKIAMNIEQSHLESHEMTSSDQELFTFFSREVVSVDYKAGISRRKPRLHPLFNQSVWEVFQAQDNQTQHRRLEDLVSTFPFFLRQVSIGSAYSEVSAIQHNLVKWS